MRLQKHFRKLKIRQTIMSLPILINPSTLKIVIRLPSQSDSQYKTGYPSLLVCYPVQRMHFSCKTDHINRTSSIMDLKLIKRKMDWFRNWVLRSCFQGRGKSRRRQHKIRRMFWGIWEMHRTTTFCTIKKQENTYKRISAIQSYLTTGFVLRNWRSFSTTRTCGGRNKTRQWGGYTGI